MSLESCSRSGILLSGLPKLLGHLAHAELLTGRRGHGWQGHLLHHADTGRGLVRVGDVVREQALAEQGGAGLQLGLMSPAARHGGHLAAGKGSASPAGRCRRTPRGGDADAAAVATAAAETEGEVGAGSAGVASLELGPRCSVVAEPFLERVSPPGAGAWRDAASAGIEATSVLVVRQAMQDAG
eukprot:CAMPEP_0183511758 /NCGR_PEP_ID=MMETSP0371-20130417/11108_1 /TAXON_ID=268820 /ORGANISM="Peridinium aciculiferum, Strain PAER-2" /LENGTH=183 /DNA_ID=CAMNT_0025708727 /DNA_START=372 /DNA_END=919 /DNA_ORIENTATION=+